MTANGVRRVAFWLGLATAAAVPLVPPIYRWCNPRQILNGSAGEGRTDWFAGMATALGEAIAISIWTAAIAAVAAIASLIAWAAARRGRHAARVQWRCFVPAALALAAWCWVG